MMPRPESFDNLVDKSKRAHLTPLTPVLSPTSSTTPEAQEKNGFLITPEMQEAFDIYRFFRRHPPPGRFNSVLYGSTKAKPYRATPMPDDFYRPLPGLVDVRNRFIGVHNSPWSIFSGLPFAGVRIDMKINESEFGMTSFRTAHARPSPQQQIIFSYLCQTLYFEKKPASYLTAQIYLCQNQLKSLVGDIIPQHFTAMRSAGKLELCSVLPFCFFCISASSDMPDMLKAGVVYALSQIHAKGVCLGNVELSNFFVGDNLKIFVCDLTRATAFIPNHEEGIRAASPEDMLLEMRKLKFLLNYTDSRSMEYSRIVDASNWDRHVRAEFFKQHLDETYHPNIPEVPHHDIRTILTNLYSEHSWFNVLEQRPRMYIPPHYDRTTIYLALGRFSRSIGNNIPAPPPEVEPPDTSTPRYDLRKRKQAPESEAQTPPTKRHCQESAPDCAPSEFTTPPKHQTSSQSSKWKHGSLHTVLQNYQDMQPSIIENNLNPKYPPVVVRDYGYELWFRKKEGPQVKFKSPTIQTFSFTSPPNSIPRVDDCDTSSRKKRFREEESLLRPSLKRRRLDDGACQLPHDTCDDIGRELALGSRVTSDSRRTNHRRRPRSRMPRLSATISSFFPSSIGNFLYSWFGI